MVGLGVQRREKGEEKAADGQPEVHACDLRTCRVAEAGPGLKPRMWRAFDVRAEARTYLRGKGKGKGNAGVLRFAQDDGENWTTARGSGRANADGVPSPSRWSGREVGMTAKIGQR
jgi:hypothetical protein